MEAIEAAAADGKAKRIRIEIKLIEFIAYCC